MHRWFTIVLAIFTTFLLTLHLAQYITKNADRYATQFNPKMYENMYGQSQYVRLDPLQNLPDEYLYALAAWKYTTGENPALFNADQPPLGKYIIGLGIHLFGNEKITTPIFVIATILVFFLLCKIVLRNTILALITTTIFSFEKLLLVQMVYAPLLDIYQLFFILLSLLFAALSTQKSKYLVPAMVAIGCVMGTKYFATGVVLIAALIGDGLLQLVLEYWQKKKKKAQKITSIVAALPATKRLLLIVASTPIAIVTLLVIYLPAYWQGYTPRMILGTQRYIYEFHSQKIHFNPLDIWQLLLLNRWHVPWEGVFKPSVDWQFTWTAITVGAVIMSVVVIRKTFTKQKKPAMQNRGMLQFIIVWTFLYLITLMSAHVVPRYVLPLLPSLYILTAALVKYKWHAR